MLVAAPRRALAALVVGLLVLLAPATAAWGHAELSSTDPASGSVVPVAPEDLTLRFTESVSLQSDGVRVLDPRGERVDRSKASAAGSVVTVPLVDDLGPGTYVVAWRVVSADGHPVRGAYTFSVQRESEVADGAAASAFASGGDRAFDVAGAVLRIVAYVAALGACGAVLVGAALWRPGDPSPVGRPVAIGASAALAAVLLQVPLQGALASGRGLGSVLDPSVLGLALADGMGLAALVAAVGLLAVVITAGLPWDGAARDIALAGALVGPLSFATSGHTRTMEPVVPAHVADAVHLLAAAVWFGGLVAVTVAVRRRRRDGDPVEAAAAIARFSTWAAVSAGAVAVTGGALGLIEVGSLEALTSTTYGRLLVAKVAAVGVVVAMAAWNRFRLVPRIAAAAVEDPPADAPAAWSSLLRIVRAEALVLVAVLALTGVLANVTPARDARPSGPASADGVLGEGTFQVTVDPARPGRNDIHVFLYDASGQTETRYDAAGVRLELPAQDLGPFDLETAPVGPGHFQVVAADLPIPGEWTVTVTVKPDRFTEQTGSVKIPIR